MRLVAGVVLGYVFFAVAAGLLFAVSGHDPHAVSTPGFMIASTVFGMVAALVAGFIASAVAKRADGRASVVVTMLIVLGAIISMVASPAAGTLWTQIAALILIAPCALAGSWFYRKLRPTLFE